MCNEEWIMYSNDKRYHHWLSPNDSLPETPNMLLTPSKLTDNGQYHVEKTTYEKIVELEWEIMSHPPYLPDLSPTYSHLFLSVDNHMKNIAVQQFIDEPLRNEMKTKVVVHSGLDVTDVKPEINTTSRSPIVVTGLEVFDRKKTQEIPRRSYTENDADLLGIGLATGAPLDLESEGKAEAVYHSRNQLRTTTSPINLTEATSIPTTTRGRGTTHTQTAFEKLAVDYRTRLAGTVDIDKMLKSFYKNAYIALVERNDLQKIQKPEESRRSYIEQK
uniref:Histone-lysine N-methyltransferase SETMAR n=1 Tax=Heterorhabditis bacteriophora TaxID=37862 RepID=A0A1I7XTW8_HETBA